MAHWELNLDAQSPEPTVILVGGYSIAEREHMLFRLEWVPDDRRWRASVRALVASDVVFIGDDTKAARRVASQARAHRRPRSTDDWHMEPLATIHDACEDRNGITVGGTLHFVKTYMHGSARAYGFVDSSRTDDVITRGTRVDHRAASEITASERLVDLCSGG